MSHEDGDIHRQSNEVERARRRAPLTWVVFEWALALLVGDGHGQCPEADRVTLEGLTLCLGECARRAVRLAPGAETDTRRRMTALLRPWVTPTGASEPPCAWCGSRCRDYANENEPCEPYGARYAVSYCISQPFCSSVCQVLSQTRQ